MKKKIQCVHLNPNINHNPFKMMSAHQNHQDIYLVHHALLFNILITVVTLVHHVLEKQYQSL